MGIKICPIHHNVRLIFEPVRGFYQEKNKRIHFFKLEQGEKWTHKFGCGAAGDGELVAHAHMPLGHRRHQ